MSNYDNNLSGALFKNIDKAKPNAPDYKGECEINKQPYWISAWVNQTREGKNYMKLSFREKIAPPPPNWPSQGPQPEPDFNDDIPF